IAHAILITAGYALIAGDTIGAVISSYLADDNLQLAIAGTGLFLAVGVASMAAVRRAARYEVWHAIHLATYAAILFGLVHQVTNGAQFADQPVASVLWVGACVVPVTVLLVNRLVRPLVSNLRHRFTLVEVVPEASGVYSLVIGGRDLQQAPGLAGQYVRVHAQARGLRFASNPYSLSVAPGGAHWRITVGAVGEHSRRLVGLRPGTRLWLEGPLGGLVLGPRSAAPVVLIAGGTGVAPIRALAEAALRERPWSPVVVWYRVHDPAQALFGAEWERLTAWAGGRLAVHLRTGARTAHRNRLDAAALTAIAPWIDQAEVLVCGGRALVESARQAARDAGASNVRVESFGW
ncbi:MAG: ferredoxin reductase family protein, partial [Actinomycetia bacterium]|nr:ferredoxin reductase family protein [Actinomycetes bacterium]